MSSNKEERRSETLNLRKMPRVSLLAAGCPSRSKYKLSESSGIKLSGRKIRFLSKASTLPLSFTDPLSKLGTGTDRLNVCVNP